MWSIPRNSQMKMVILIQNDVFWAKMINLKQQFLNNEHSFFYDSSFGLLKTVCTSI